MGNKKKQTNEFDNYFDDDFEVVYEDLEDLGSYLSEDSSDNNNDYDDYDGYDGDTDYYDYDDYDDDDDDDYYDDDYDDYDYNSNGRDSKKEKRNDKQDPDSKKSKKKKRCGLPNVGKPVAKQPPGYRARAFVLCYHLRRFLSGRHVQSPDSKFSKLAYRCTRRTVYLRWAESHTTAAVHCRSSKLCGQENYSKIRFKTVSFINFVS